jgi:hypothetical protein
MGRAEQRRLLRMMARHGIATFGYASAGESVDLVLDADLHPEIVCRQAGVFVHRHPTDSAPAAFPRHVRAGESVAYVRIGALLLPIVARIDGWLPEPLPDDGARVGYGDVLF